MLQNLKQIMRAKKGDDVRTYWVVDRLVLPRSGRRGGAARPRAHLRRPGLRPAAARDLGAYLERAPGAPDASEIREVLATLRAAPNLLN